jgi:hypothetical protein
MERIYKQILTYRFILCAEGLTTLVKRHENRGDIHGFKVCRGAPSLSHLLFANDCLLFFGANVREIDCLKHILKTYYMQKHLVKQLIMPNQRFILAEIRLKILRRARSLRNYGHWKVSWNVVHERKK